MNKIKDILLKYRDFYQEWLDKAVECRKEKMINYYLGKMDILNELLCIINIEESEDKPNES